MNHSEESHQSKLEYGLQVLVYFCGFLPLILLVRAYLSGNLGFNPVEAVLHRTGQTAVVLLLLSLACTPLHLVFKFPPIGRLRKPFGLFATLYAALHFAAFAIWDYQLNLNLIWTEITGRPFILIGAAALVILLLLAATSLEFLQRKMGKWWKRLHRLAYAAGVLVGTHYLLAVKGNLFKLQGVYGAPLATGGILILMLILRLPVIYRPLRRLAGREHAEE